MYPYTFNHSISIVIFMKSIIFLKKWTYSDTPIFLFFYRSHIFTTKILSFRRQFSIIFLQGFLKRYKSNQNLVHN